MRKLLIAFALVLLVLPMAAWSMGTNLDFEGGFDPVTGVATGWDQFVGATNSGSDTEFHGGAWSQKCDFITGEGGISQALSLTDGHTYQISVWIKCIPGGGGYVDIDGGWAHFSDSTEWTEVSFPYVYRAATGLNVLYLDAYPNTCYFDDVTITDITPPAMPSDPDGKGPLMLWREYTSTDGAWNPFSFGGVFDGKAIMGQIMDGVYLMGDTQVGGTAVLCHTPRHIPNDDYTAKGATMLNGHIIGVTGYGDFQQSLTAGASLNWDAELGTIIPFDPQGTGSLGIRHKEDPEGSGYDAAAVVTDGTYLYAYSVEGANDAGTSKIYKFSVNHAANGGNGSIARVAPFPITIPGTVSKISGIGYWNGKIYAAEAYNGGNIFEIDCTTGAVTTLALNVPVPASQSIGTGAGGATQGFGQIARYGDKIFLATENAYLFTWQLIGATWTLVSADALGLTTLTDYPGAMGLAVKGDGVNAKYAWISSQGHVSYWDLYPYSPSSVGDPNNYKEGLPVRVENAVVTALGTDGFFVESKERTAGAHVVWSGTMPTVGHLVNIQGTGSKSASGERILTPVVRVAPESYPSAGVEEGAIADPAIKPLFVTNKSLGTGLATDGMLVTISGKVTGIDYNTAAFYIDDGSGLASDFGEVKGVKLIQMPNGADLTNVTNFDMVIYGTPCYAVVTGIVRCEGTVGAVTYRVDPLNDASVVITAL